MKKVFEFLKRNYKWVILLCIVLLGVSGYHIYKYAHKDPQVVYFEEGSKKLEKLNTTIYEKSQGYYALKMPNYNHTPQNDSLFHFIEDIDAFYSDLSDIKFCIQRINNGHLVVFGLKPVDTSDEITEKTIVNPDTETNIYLANSIDKINEHTLDFINSYKSHLYLVTKHHEVILECIAKDIRPVSCIELNINPSDNAVLQLIDSYRAFFDYFCSDEFSTNLLLYMDGLYELKKACIESINNNDQ